MKMQHKDSKDEIEVQSSQVDRMKSLGWTEVKQQKGAK